MIDLNKLWEAMPRDVQRKISCHDLKRIVENYNVDPPEMQGESEATKWLLAKMKNALDAADLDSQNSDVEASAPTPDSDTLKPQ